MFCAPTCGLQHFVSTSDLSAQALVVQAMAASRIPNFDDHLLVNRAIALTHQVAYCFANYEAGLDLCIRPSQGLPDGHYRALVSRQRGGPSCQPSFTNLDQDNPMLRLSRRVGLASGDVRGRTDHQSLHCRADGSVRLVIQGWLCAGLAGKYIRRTRALISRRS